MPDREKVIKGLETCGISGTREDCEGYGCPYFVYNDEVSDECIVHLFEDAIALLKAQEPKEPRVMTVDEVGTWISVPRIDREPIWVETENSVNAWIVSDEYWDMQIDVNLSSDLYGKTWRCWTSRPADEQREATPWMT